MGAPTQGGGANLLFGNFFQCLYSPFLGASHTNSAEFMLTKNVIHVISFEPIGDKTTSRIFHEPNVKLASVIGAFWRAIIAHSLNR